MAIINSTGATTYPNPNQMQTNVQGPAYEVAPWKPIEYAATPEYAPLSWQMQGIRGGWPPTTHNTRAFNVDPRIAELKAQQAALAEAQPKWMYVRGPYGLEVAPTLANFEQHGRSWGLTDTAQKSIADEHLKGVMTPLEAEQLKREQMAREKATSWGNATPGGGADWSGERAKQEEQWQKQRQLAETKAQQAALAEAQQQSK